MPGGFRGEAGGGVRSTYGGKKMVEEERLRLLRCKGVKW